MAHHFEPGVSLILGGARSGKSRFAEQLAQESTRSKLYVATAQAFDGEMDQRIALHRERRGEDWQLVEEPLDLLPCLTKYAGADTVVLVDCLTLWLTNLMMNEKNIQKETERLVGVLAQLGADASILLVSNEVGQGIVPMDKMARDFRDHAGRLHQQIASIAEHVWFVTAGLPQKLK